MNEAIEVALRTLFAVIGLFLLTRLLGKRQISQLSFFEYITGISIGSLAATLSLDLDATWYLGMIALVVWVLVSIGIEFLQMKSKTMRDWLDSKATVLIKDGKVLEDNLKKERLTSDELLAQLRSKNVFRAADVEFAIMEPSGEINVLVKKEHLPLTPSQLGIKVSPEQEPQAVIMDGNILDEPLSTIGLNRGWLETELKKIGVMTENVYLGQVDAYGQLFVDLYDDMLQVPAPQTKASLLAQIKKCEADLEMFGLSTQDQQAKEMYNRCSQKLEALVREIKPYLIQ